MEPDQKNHEELSDTSSSDDELSSSFDSDSTSSEDDGADLLMYNNINCIVIFNIDINPDTFELIYSLRAVPYMLRRKPFKSLDENAKVIGEIEKPFYDLFHCEGKDNILAVLKKLLDNKIEIDRVRHYVVKFHGVIGGTYAKYYLSPYNCVFKHDINHAFISYIDLVLQQNLQVENDKLLELFDIQNATYGTKLSSTHIERINSLLREDHTRQREENLRRYTAKVTEKAATEPQSQAQPQTNMYLFIQTLLSWLPSYLSPTHPTTLATTEQPNNVACQSQVGSIQLRQVVIARLRANEYDSTKALKQDLKQLFALRRYFEPNTAHYAHCALVSSQISTFLRGLTEPECWNDPATIKQARRLIIESILLTDSVLADMECFLRQAGKEPTALLMAQLLTDQSYQFCRNFIYTGIIELYPSLREKTWLEKIPYVTVNGKSCYNHFVADRAETNALFFNHETPENVMRKLYNTFIKDGFYQRYGIETNGENDYRDYLRILDTRFGTWSTPDKKVEVPAAETWGQFFSRKVTGAPAPVKERYTYAHPIHHTRPT